MMEGVAIPRVPAPPALPSSPRLVPVAPVPHSWSQAHPGARSCPESAAVTSSCAPVSPACPVPAPSCAHVLPVAGWTLSHYPRSSPQLSLTAPHLLPVTPAAPSYCQVLPAPPSRSQFPPADPSCPLDSLLLAWSCLPVIPSSFQMPAGFSHIIPHLLPQLPVTPPSLSPTPSDSQLAQLATGFSSLDPQLAPSHSQSSQ